MKFVPNALRKWYLIDFNLTCQRGEVRQRGGVFCLYLLSPEYTIYRSSVVTPVKKRAIKWYMFGSSNPLIERETVTKSLRQISKRRISMFVFMLTH